MGDRGVFGGGGHSGRESHPIRPSPLRGGAVTPGTQAENEFVQLLTILAHSRYWECLFALTLSLLVLQTFLHPTSSSLYTQIIGYVGLAIEAILPLPQIFANQRNQSCKGFRLSVLANWLLGDAMKMGFFFVSEPGKVPWAFKMCALFQTCCDVMLGVQYWVYKDGQQDREGKTALEKEGRLT